MGSRFVSDGIKVRVVKIRDTGLLLCRFAEPKSKEETQSKRHVDPMSISPSTDIENPDED